MIKETQQQEGSDGVLEFVNKKGVELTKDFDSYERLCRGEQTRVRIRLTSLFTARCYAVAKAKQRCVMGVGMCLYAQLVQTKNKQCKSAIMFQCYHPHLSEMQDVRLSVCPSVTRRYSIETAKHIIKLFSPRVAIPF